MPVEVSVSAGRKHEQSTSSENTEYAKDAGRARRRSRTDVERRHESANNSETDQHLLRDGGEKYIGKNHRFSRHEGFIGHRHSRLSKGESSRYFRSDSRRRRSRSSSGTG